MMKLQLFGGRGVSSGGSFKMIGHKLPDTGKPNSSTTRYDKNRIKRDKRYYDKYGNRKKDIHFTGPPNHEYPHEHYWHRDENGNWYRTSYQDWTKGVK